MSSFVNDNVSESKKEQDQQKVTEIQGISEETISTETSTAATLTAIEATNKNNLAEEEETKISINDKQVNKKCFGVNNENENIKRVNENKSETSKENNLKNSIATTKIVNNNDNSKSDTDVVNVRVATDDKDKYGDKDNVAIGVDNNQKFNKTGDAKKLTTAQITKSISFGAATVAAVSAATCCVSDMPPGDIEQQQQQQVASFIDINHPLPLTATKAVINECNNDVTLTFTTSKLPAEGDSKGANDLEKCECSVNTSSNPLPAATVSSLPPLPHSHLPYISSEPTLGVQLRNINLEDQKYNNKNNNTPTKITSSRSGSSAIDCTPRCSNSVIKSGTVSASVSPNMVRKISESSVLLPRRVSFPKSDNELVTGYLEPANPWEHVYMVKSISEIAELYITSCQKHNTNPLQIVLDHLKAVDLTKQLRRQPLLSLKSIKLAPSDCEALEEVLKRVQYKSIDLSDCKLDETAASALFDMIEYYEAAHELDISSNAAGMTHRGWTSCIYMISHSQELQVLNAEGNPISKVSADHLGNALSTSNLHTLKLEHCGLKGAPLSGLCFKLYHNKVLKELWLAHNDLDCNDADTIAEMLKCNHYLELIDISNNNIRDEGLRHIVKALIMQSKELERRTTFQRTAAIDDDGEYMSPVESSPPLQLADNNDDDDDDDDGDDDDGSLDWKKKKQSTNETKGSLTAAKKSSDLVGESNLSKESSNLPSIEEKVKGIEVETISDDVQCEHHKVKPPLVSSVGSTIDENDGDDDTDDTVRSNTIKSPLQTSTSGQSMLDKLLSMNSESSSEEGASNLSTDTLAACNSEDASLISDEIFDSAATATTVTSTNTNTKALTNTALDVSSISESSGTVISAIVDSTTTTTASLDVVHEGKVQDEKILQNSSRECELIESNNQITLNESNLILVNSTSNFVANSPNVQSSIIVNNNTSNNNNNSDTGLQNINIPISAMQTANPPAFSNNALDPNLARSDVFEVTAEESDCLLSVPGSDDVVSHVVGDNVEVRTAGEHSNIIQHHAASRALDVNKNTKLGEDFDDTHSTDSAFESASEGDISRHLPEEFTRLSASLESTRFDDIAKELAIETATIASESNECLIAAAAQVTPSSTPTPPTPPFTNLSTPLTERERLPVESPINSCLVTTTAPPPIQVGFTNLDESAKSSITSAYDVCDKLPKVTIAQDSFTQKYKSNSGICTNPSQTPTPPPPSTSPGGASSGLRRTESTSCGFLTQSSRNRSQSTDSLCSDNSLDGSIGSGDLNFSCSSNLNEKITKNDTLTRQQRPIDATPEIGTRTPGGLKALAVWNNNLTKESGIYVSDLLAETVSLELLNIGKNCLSNEFVTSLKDSLTKNTTLTTLGLQSAHLSAKGIETLSSILTFGGNSTLQRIDIRDNKLEVESLTKIAEVLKSNTSVTQIDIDDEPKRLSVGSEAHMDYARVLENVRSMCSRNEKSQTQMQQEKSTASFMTKRRGGYYLGSRKISLTCQSRPVMDTTKNMVVSASNSKLDIKRKAGTRLRSPVPSPTTISPSSSPNRASRFQVFRVTEASPLTSPGTQKPIVSNLVSTKAVSISSAALPLSLASEREGNYPNISSTSLPTSCSLPSMATISSSTQSIKRLSVSPRSRFVVRKVYEDPNLPVSSPLPTPATRSIKDKCAEQLRQDSANSSRSGRKIATTTEATFVTQSPPTIITPQQEIDTTTDTSPATRPAPILNLNQDTSVTTATTPIIQVALKTNISTTQKCEQSTNSNTIDENITKQLQTPTTATTKVQTQTLTSTPLSTAPVIVPMSSSNLQQSSSSVLPALSSSSDSSASSSSSSSSTSPASNNFSSDSSSSPASSVHSDEALLQQPQQHQSHDLTASLQCPIAVFGDNDITLTKNTVSEIFGQVAAATKENYANNVEASNENVVDPTSAAQQQQEHQLLQQQQQRVRKVSWISNPTAVDKLLTLFRRSSSPESKTVTTSTTTMTPIQISQPPPTYAEAAAAAVMTAQQQQQHKLQTSLVPLCKQSTTSWTKLGNDIITAAATNNVDLANTVATTAAAAVTEQSRSFFDAASKQFRDFSKQVFRQNLSFGNEPVTTASSNSTTMTTSSALFLQPSASESVGDIFLGRTGEYCGCCCHATSTGCLCGGTLTAECSANCIPTDVKQEIKENISPEHTVNEETLHTIQKICSCSAVITSATSTINCDIDNANNVNAASVSSTLTAVAAAVPATSTPSPPTPTPTQTTQIQQSTVATSSDIENDLLAHNN